MTEGEVKAPAKDAAAKKKGASAKGGKKKSKVTHPRTLDMVLKAIEGLKEPKGSSVSAIKKYVLAHNSTVRSDMIKYMLKRAFTQGLKEGKLSRPHSQGTKAVLTGSYKLAKADGAKGKAAATKKSAKPKAAKARSPSKAKKAVKVKSKVAKKSPKKVAKKSSKKSVKPKSPKPKKAPAKKAAKKSGGKKAKK